MQTAFIRVLERTNVWLAYVAVALALCHVLLLLFMTDPHWDDVWALMPPLRKSPWIFVVRSSEHIEGEAEVRTRAHWDQVHAFATFPTEFTMSEFDPTAERLVIHWPVGEPRRRFCVDVRRGDTLLAKSPRGQIFVGATVLNEYNLCEIVLTQQRPP